ncbi:hypothetical protein EVAR_89405_1 [Eumeta japonica]|uniref:Uncharacterized protein n=1 Tax=Eumeta variegata TaxID=151549 RepID=A0A4C1XSD9_EUMVA|nr:hypothetical protein EVAR_89405_1 [Eumeta japonica]
MAATAPGTATAGGTASSSKTLPLGELKIMFFKFLEQQGYALPSEVDSVLGLGSSDSTNNNNKHNVGSRGQSPCPSVRSSAKRSSNALSSDKGSDNSDSTIKGSDNEEFQIVKRNNKRVARRLRKSSNSSQSNDSAMEIEQAKRDKSKWNLIASECNRLHINFNKAQNTRNGINITTSSIDDFGKLNSYLIKNGLPFHTYALEEERKVKPVIKGVPVEIETEDIKADLERQEYPVQAVHRMHRRDGTALEGKPACCNCGSDHTANYGGCPAAPKPKLKNSSNKNIIKVQQTSSPLYVSHFPALNSGNKQTAWTVPAKPTGSKNSSPPQPPTLPARPHGEPMEESSSMDSMNSKTNGTENRVAHKQPTRQARTAASAASALGDDIGTIMSILQVVKSAEVADLAAKFRKAKHGVDRLKIILENQELISRLENL